MKSDRGTSCDSREVGATLTLRFTVAVLCVLLAMSGTAAAQGRGAGTGPRTDVPATTARGTQTSTAPALQPSSFPQFGIWLDDATTADRGVGFGSIGVSYWRGSGADQINAPILGVTYGIARRAHLTATVPFYRTTYDGVSGSGLGTVYVSGKVAVINPDAGKGPVGFAVGAVAEIPSAGFADASRVHWAVPLSLEIRGTAARLYGSTGYFSRGAYFAAGAFEWTMPTGTSLTTSLAHSASVRGLTVATTTRVPRASLRDLSVSISQAVSNIASVHVGASRTFSETWIDGASAVSAGLSFRFASATRE